jgi:hypothetical protein
MSTNDKSEVAVEKVAEAEKIDPKAEVKGTKRPAEVRKFNLIFILAWIFSVPGHSLCVYLGTI